MKILSFILILFTIISCKEQVDNKDLFKLTISPSVDLSDVSNQEVIKTLEGFLITKNDSVNSNIYWLDNDFDRFIFPFQDIFQIEKSKHGNNYFKPSLMEIINIETDQKLLKIGFIGNNPETNETIIRCIYNIVATNNEGHWKLKRAIDHRTKDWQVLQVESVKYIIPTAKIANQKQIKKQANDIRYLCNFFETDPIDITYYSCNSPKHMFEIMGFDYIPNMYYNKSGGKAGYGDIVYSGNNSEFYTHEIVHVYTKNLFRNIKSLLDEGIATYIGGSGIYDYQWHRDKLKNYLDHTNVNFGAHLNPYESLYIKQETSIPYMIGALVCENVHRRYGKDKLLELLRSDKDLWDSLGECGLTKENFNKELLKELQLPSFPYVKP